MKKLFGIMFLVAAIASTSAFAQTQSNKPTKNKAQTVSSQNFRGPNFVDKNNDGVCDNRGTNMRRSGANFIDKNNDGVCDNYGKRKFDQNRNRKGNGKGKHHRRGKGNGNGNGRGKK